MGETQTTVKSVREKLWAIQQALKAPKTESGRFGLHRNAEGILEALKPLLKDHRAAVTVDCEIAEINGKNYIKATATLIDIDSKEPQQISVTAWAWEGEISRGLDAPQVSGAASSYAKKYALAGLFSVDDGKDDPDRHEAPAEPPAPSEPPKRKYATAPQKYELRDLMKSKGLEADAQTDFIQSVIEKSRVNTVEEYQAVKDALEEEPDETEEAEDV